jgi:uncharacterized OB-fold protein
VTSLPLPTLDADNRAFWTGGEHGQLMISRCNACHHWLHPPVPVCRYCLSTDVAPAPAAGTGRVFSYTVNHQQWLPGQHVPYLLVIVELDDEPDLRLISRLVGVDATADVDWIGTRVRAVFEQVDDIWLPLFTPDETA